MQAPLHKVISKTKDANRLKILVPDAEKSITRQHDFYEKCINGVFVTNFSYDFLVFPFRAMDGHGHTK